MPFSVLFVCTGNSCRSPMAEGILRSMLPGDRLDFDVSSAGTADIDGMPAAGEAIEVCMEHGVDISGHRSAGLTAEMIWEADLIFAMAEHHLVSITEKVASSRTKSYLLSEFADGSQHDVPDPVGAPKAEYEDVYDMLEGYLSDSLDRVLMLAARKSEKQRGERPGNAREEEAAA